MNFTNGAPQDQRQWLELQQKQQLERRFLNGMNWFFWIAALSLINMVLSLFGADFVFTFGLGATQVVDAIFSVLADEAGTSATLYYGAGVIINLLIACLFAILGLLGRSRRRAAVISGMVLYLLDGILSLAFQDYIGAAFHAWALFGIFTGLRALGQLEAKPKLPGSEVIQTLD